MKAWKIKAYATLVRLERYDLEPVEGGTKSVVEEEYRIAVAEYLLTGEIVA
ncbi:hypothetical protein EUAN_12240 [Andreesenia angusta]|uniref:Uncharacterized protein n=1 Tax=Andreesenia angusta TaxID=39480 RepID=A0A1S1V6W6_9FIRM|nr:CD1375 family protein [Andreesenia angusta]OHW62155.1 hypothetical protein EUAN_12240 [Andreesenia angusta]